MINVMFVCHGNICRSPMAEFVLRDMVTKLGKNNEFFIASAATSTEEIGNPVHHGTKSKLAAFGISVKGKYAIQLTKSDYDKYDYIIGMDSANISGILRITGGDPDGKVKKLLDYTEHPRDIADPWYTGDFEATYRDIKYGCEEFLKYLDKIK